MHSTGPKAGLAARLTAAGTAVLLTTSMILSSGATVVAQDQEDADPASVVVTTEVLGSLVSDLVGEVADVTVLMSGGTNPHTFEPSARDAEAILRADLLVSNGLDLEEGLLTVLEAAESEGVPWFEAAEHIALRDLEADSEGEDAGEATHEEEHEHEHGSDTVDPHIWTDPLAMRDVVMALEAALSEQGIDVGDGGTELVAELEALDAEVVGILSVVPAEKRKLVTGHRSMGYFADRYGFEQIGTVIPSLSTSGEPTARELSTLISDIKDNDVSAVFAEVGTPQSVARAVADDSGATLVELSAVMLPEDGTYASLIRDMATTVAEALGE